MMRPNHLNPDNFTSTHFIIRISVSYVLLAFTPHHHHLHHHLWGQLLALIH